MEIEQLNEIRKERGLQIANTSRIMKRERGGYIVPSQSGSGVYVVRYNSATFKFECECEDYEKRSVLGILCKHCLAVQTIINKEINSDGTTTITKTVKVTYPQDWSVYNTAQTQQKELFLKLLNDLCKSIHNPENTMGRPKLAMSDMVFASALKVFTTFSCRRFITDMKEAKENGYIDKVCAYSSVSNYMRNPNITPLLVDLIQKSSMSLKPIETEFRRHYHLRSNVESTFSMMKRKFSDYLKSRKDQSQKNEILCKVVCHNISVLVNGIFELDLKLEWN